MKFINYNPYNNLDDLLHLKFKYFADVIEDYPDREKKIEFPIEQKVIAEYLFKSGIVEERRGRGNVSFFKTKYKEYRKAFS